MKKQHLLFLFVIGLFAACQSVDAPIINIESATLEVGDSVYVSVANCPENKAFFYMMKEDSAFCTIQELTDTSAMVYANKVGSDMLEVHYIIDHRFTFVAESWCKYIPIEVIPASE